MAEAQRGDALQMVGASAEVAGQPDGTDEVCVEARGGMDPLSPRGPLAAAVTQRSRLSSAASVVMSQVGHRTCSQLCVISPSHVISPSRVCVRPCVCTFVSRCLELRHWN